MIENILIYLSIGFIVLLVSEMDQKLWTGSFSTWVEDVLVTLLWPFFCVILLAGLVWMIYKGK